MTASAQALLAGIVDYAGTFPPANMPLPEALAEYDRARASAEAWLLGRLVISIDALSDFERLAVPFVGRDSQHPWDLSVIVTGNDPNQFDRMRAFERQLAGEARVAAVEVGPVPASSFGGIVRSLPSNVEVFFETPLHEDKERPTVAGLRESLDERLRAIKGVGAGAKIRTGGVTAGAFPSPAAIVRFLECANRVQISFKATAGLHHALRGCYPLTYETGSAADTMHGFLNLAFAAALVRAGALAAQTADVLHESSFDAFEFRSGGIAWNDCLIATDDVIDCRAHFFRSFGSCSFREPAAELRRSHAL